MLRGTRNALTAALLAALTTGGGCAVAEVVDQSQAIRLMLRPVYGSIVAPELPDGATVPGRAFVVVLYQGTGELFELHNYRVYRAPGVFVEVLPPGEFRLAAFEDTNGNFAYDVGERFGQLDAGETLWGGGAEAAKVGVILSLDTTGTCDLPPGSVVHDVAAHPRLAKSHPSLMVIANLDLERFSQHASDMGAWAPLDAIRAYGSGLYSFGVPDPSKIPVVFVHGAQGTPDQWEAMISRVDLQRYQPWIYHYPTALPLKLTSWSFSCMINEAVVRFALPKFVVAAHSMGGLVSRAMIRWQLDGARTPAVERLITVASPFGGHSDAAFGASWISADVGYWRDLNPESLFLQWLYDTPWPADLPHYMIIAVGGEQNSKYDEANDGTVPVPSQIEPRIQRHATAVAVVAEEHSKILLVEEGMHHFFRFMDDGR